MATGLATALVSWWRKQKVANAAKWDALAPHEDQGLIASQVPELVGMSLTEGMAYVLRQFDVWNETATPSAAATLSIRLAQSQAGFEEQGKTMPYWGNLWVLRTLQAELGIAAPAVALQVERPEP